MNVDVVDEMARLTEIPKSLVEPVEPSRRIRECGLQTVSLGVALLLSITTSSDLPLSVAMRKLVDAPWTPCLGMSEQIVFATEIEFDRRLGTNGRQEASLGNAPLTNKMP